MKDKIMTAVFALALVAGFAALVPMSSAQSGDLHGDGDLHVTKECLQYTGLAGGFCTITSSNLAAIKVGSKVFYDQDLNTPPGMLDSNIVLDAGDGNRAVGRCTVELATFLGLCTFSDGIGHFTGFHARVYVSPATDGVNYHWDGTYSFSPEPPR